MFFDKERREREREERIRVMEKEYKNVSTISYIHILFITCKNAINLDVTLQKTQQSLKKIYWASNKIVLQEVCCKNLNTIKENISFQ